MKIYNFESNSIIQAGMRQYVNSGVIDDVEKFMLELDGILSKIQYYEQMELKYADLMEDNFELRQGIELACQKLEKLNIVKETSNEL